MNKPHTTSAEPARLLRQIAQLGPMEKGTLSVIRQTADGPCCNFQRWEAGRNRSEYIPAEQLAQVRGHIETHGRFEQLVEEYVREISARSRQQRLQDTKKKNSRRKPSSWLGKPKSKA